MAGVTDKIAGVTDRITEITGTVGVTGITDIVGVTDNTRCVSDLASGHVCKDAELQLPVVCDDQGLVL